MPATRYLIAASALTLASALPADASIFSPSQSELLDIIDVTASFDGGGSLFAASLDGDGVLYDMDFAQGTDGISRVVLENSAFAADLTGLDSFDILFNPQTFAMGVKTYIETGAGDFFESPLQQVGVNTTQRISLPLTGLSGLEDVNAFGVQIFDPDNGTSFATLAKVQTAEPPKPTITNTLFSWENGLEGWTDPAPEFFPNTDTTRQVVSANATDGVSALAITRTTGSPNFRWGSEVRFDIEAGNTQEEVDEVANLLNNATFLAFDITIDPNDIDPPTDFLGFNVSINDDSGAFYQSSQQFFNETEAGTYTYQTPLTDFEGFNNGLTLAEAGIVENTAAIIFLLSTNTNGPGTYYIDNFRLITELDGLPGDVNNDGTIDIADINAFYAEFGGTNTAFDLDGDSDVDTDDAIYLITQIIGSAQGDANLDLAVDLIDLSALASNFGSTLITDYALGDFNLDGEVNLIDLSNLATNFGFTAAAPEPAGAATLLLLASLLGTRKTA
ncbi:hypothetical protein [Mucisphaera sp.]|uniref:hypothetical protein n=1 Tax=Mucisphaera sp. TaxID=2913024 RepID=UPI003D0ED041